MKLVKITTGHYRNAKGEVQNIASESGAPHTRNARAKWLVTYANGKPSTIVAHLSTARLLLA